MDYIMGPKVDDPIIVMLKHFTFRFGKKQVKAIPNSYARKKSL
jgi:hypothetical protein